MPPGARSMRGRTGLTRGIDHGTLRMESAGEASYKRGRTSADSARLSCAELPHELSCGSSAIPRGIRSWLAPGNLPDERELPASMFVPAVNRLIGRLRAGRAISKIVDPLSHRRLTMCFPTLRTGVLCFAFASMSTLAQGVAPSDNATPANAPA